MDADSLRIEPFDFDHWLALANGDPQGFFELRARAIEACIASAPSAQRRQEMRAMQDRVDGLRITAGNPDRALQQIAGLLSQNLQQLGTQLDELRGELSRFGAAPVAR